MSMSIQTNVASMVAQNNLQMNTNFQTNTIEQLTSGHRINQAGDDAAGLAVANKYRSNIAELTQGVLNANDGVSTLQIMDGGLSNISTMLDRLNTLATESASSTFTGDRNTLNTEYQSLTQEIDRQAQNIQLNQGGANNTNLAVFIGGAIQAAGANASVNVDLSGQAVDSASLGLSNSSVSGGGNQITQTGGTGTAPNLNTATSVLGSNESQAFTVNYTNSSGIASNVTVTVKGSATGITVNDALGQINNQLSGIGVTASVDQTTGLWSSPVPAPSALTQPQARLQMASSRMAAPSPRTISLSTPPRALFQPLAPRAKPFLSLAPTIRPYKLLWEPATPPLPRRFRISTPNRKPSESLPA
jgi:flagellin